MLWQLDAALLKALSLHNFALELIQRNKASFDYGS